MAKKLFSADVERIRQIAIDAALLEHPELLPGDLADKNEGYLVHITCLTRPSTYNCQAHTRFKILSTVKGNIVREGDICFQKAEYKDVSVTVLSDGSVESVNSSGRSTGMRSIDCPADLDNKELPPD